MKIETKTEPTRCRGTIRLRVLSWARMSLSGSIAQLSMSELLSEIGNAEPHVSTGIWVPITTFNP